MTPFTDDDLKRLKAHSGGWHLDNGTLTALFNRLEAAEKVCDEAVSVAYNVATTEGTKTNSEMPQWFLARINELDTALKSWFKSAGKL